MPEAFDFAVPPFDRLTLAEQQRLSESLDLGVYTRGAVILRRDEQADCLFVVLKGLVHERHGGETTGSFGPQDAFDIRALFGSGQSHSFVAAEDTICYLVPRGLLIELARDNPGFGAFVYQDFAERLRTLATERSTRELAALTMARIRQAYLQPPLFLSEAATLRDAVAAMREAHATSAIVRHGAPGTQPSIVTESEILDAVVLNGAAADAPIGGVARPILLMIDRDDLLLKALVLMTKHADRRVVVTERGEIAGILEHTDLLGVLSNHSQVIALKIDRASTPADLGRASQDVLGLIRSLHATGVKVSLIAELVTELNRRIFRRLFELIAPADLVANSCLVVMGSEGRGEQVLKTDQDNGLILRDGFTHPDLERVTAALSEHLAAFGYPPCPGGIMASNPDWTRPLGAYKEALFRWITRADEQTVLNLAIFYDAAPVAGDPEILKEAKRYLLDRIQDNQRFFHTFARPALAFDTPSGLFAGLFERRRSEPIDIKKAAIFPIVHGVRAMALEARLVETSTLQRLWALAERGAIDPGFAQELEEAFLFLCAARLGARVDSDPAAGHIDNRVRLDAMTKMDRDQFRDCLAIVKRFKDVISHHFHLNLH